jgi:hypothetical protein
MQTPMSQEDSREQELAFESLHASVLQGLAEAKNGIFATDEEVQVLLTPQSKE